MNVHYWGDEDFDWDALDAAGHYIWLRSRQFGRLGIWTKEKYGTLRVTTTCAFFSYWPIHDLIKPGNVCYRWPLWIMRYIDLPLGRILNYIGVGYVIRSYQIFILKYFWKKAAKKWPHIREEILDDYPFGDL